MTGKWVEVCIVTVINMLCMQEVSVGTDLVLNLWSGEGNAVVVSECGNELAYAISGELSDVSNGGLAGFDLVASVTSGTMELADRPIAGPMLSFDSPLGITGPSGFRGWLVDGKLVGVGGAQNTVRKGGEWPVITSVGHSETVLVTGTVTVPSKPGTYTMSISNARATVIKGGEDGSGDFWATEPVSKITTSDLTIIVEPSAPPASAANNGPLCSGEPLSLIGGPNGAIDYRWTGPGDYYSTQQNPVVSTAIPGRYRLTVTDINGCETTAETMVELLTQPCTPWADCDANTVHDVCDVTRTLVDDCSAALPEDCLLVGDTDVDGSLELPDLPFWTTCITGPCAGPCAGGCCFWIDLDGDGDIDLSEIAEFQRTFGSK